MTRLESAVRENSTMRALQLQYDSSISPVPADVAEAILKGVLHNRGLGYMTISVPDTSELHKLVDEVEQVNRKLTLNVWHHKVSLFELSLWVSIHLRLFVNRDLYVCI